ncbi:MAG: hypothetical protein ACI4D3_03845 [Lachnospiraceae bacterium]
MASTTIHQPHPTHQFAIPHLQFSLAIAGFRESLRRRHERQVMSRRPLKTPALAFSSDSAEKA